MRSLFTGLSPASLGERGINRLPEVAALSLTADSLIIKIIAIVKFKILVSGAARDIEIIRVTFYVNTPCTYVNVKE